MKIVIAVSERDLDLAESQSNLLLKQGGLSQHSCLLVVAPCIPVFDTKLVVSNLQKAFGTFELLHLVGAVQEKGHTNPAQAKIIAANHMFQAAVRHLDETSNSVEWYWFEPDCVPLDERWADELARDYLMSSVSGRVFMGKTTCKAELQTKNGNIVIKEYPEQPYMMKSGVYPPNLSRYSGLWKTAKMIPWDVAMQWETARTHTDLGKVVNNPNSVKYVKTGPGQLTCTVIGEHTRSTKDITLTKTQLVIHGCKDTSIIDMVLSGELFSAGKSAPVGTPIPTPTPVVEEVLKADTYYPVEEKFEAQFVPDQTLEIDTQKVDITALALAESEFLKTLEELPVGLVTEELKPVAKKKAKPSPIGGLSIETTKTK